jgi:hypothetical protein
VVEGAVAERPGHDTIESIIKWLIGGARQISSFARTIDELSWRLVAAGMPLLRRQPAWRYVASSISWRRLRLVAHQRANAGDHDHA